MAGDDAAGAERLGGVEAGERLLGVARVAGAEHGPAPSVAQAGQLVAADGRPAAGSRRSPSAAAARSPPIAEPPMPQTIRPAASAGSSRADSTRQRASRRWSGMREDVVEHGSLGRGTLSSRPTTAPSSDRRPCATSTPAARIEPLTVAPARRPRSRRAGPSPRTSTPGRDPAARRRSPRAGPTLASGVDLGAGVDEHPRRASARPASRPCPRGCPRSPAGSARACRCPSSSPSSARPSRPLADQPREDLALDRDLLAGRESGRAPSARARTSRR